MKKANLWTFMGFMKAVVFAKIVDITRKVSTVISVKIDTIDLMESIGMKLMSAHVSYSMFCLVNLF